MKKVIKQLFFILMLGVTFTIQAQEKTVQGVVTDDTGQPLPGATVILVGTTKGVSTDFDGNYSITVPNGNSMLKFTSLGMLSQQITVREQTTINIMLIADNNVLDEVVVVAYGTQKRGTITGSIASIKSEKLNDVTTPSVSGMLQSKLAGVQVSSSSGGPGSSPSISIRGVSSLNSRTSPLWVIDGVIFNGTPTVNPNDVASISVLKDASATSLYGSRGSNGVIVVTTKTAKVGVSELTFSSRIGTTKFNNGNFQVMNSQQLYDYFLSIDPNPENTYTWFSEDLLNTDFDWVNHSTQDGLVQDYNLSYSGANEKSKTYITGGYNTDEGTIKGTDWDRITFRMNSEYKVNERLTLKPKLAFRFDKWTSRAHSRYQMYTNMPWDNAFDAEGAPVNPHDADIWYGREDVNYLYDLQWNYSKSKTFNVNFNMDLEYKITSNLKYLSTNSFILNYSNGMSYTDPISLAGTSNGGVLGNSNSRTMTRLTTQMLRYNADFGLHNVSALAGYEFNDYLSESFSASGKGLIGGGTVLGVTAEPNAVAGGTADWAVQSLFTGVDYTYDNRYYGKLSVRQDGASNVGIDNQYGVFYAAGAGWNIHNEKFFNIDNVNQLKLRASYGSVGNRAGSLYPYQSLYDVSRSYNNTPAATPSQLGNSDLKWEKSYETNIALDVRLFDRVSTTLEYYFKDTSDLLYWVSLSQISGYSGYWENVGGLENKGFEFSLNTEILKNTDFKWNVDFNIGFNKNKLTSLFEDHDDLQMGSKILTIGEDINTWSMREWVGVDPDNGDPLWEAIDENGVVTNTNDYNAATVQKVGTSTPDYFGGFTSNMAYKGFSLSANFSFVKGNRIYNSSRFTYDSDGAYPQFNQQVFAEGWSRWEKPGDIATHPLALFSGNKKSNNSSSRYLEDGDYLKLRNVTFAYNLPESLMTNLGISKAKIYFSGDNLLTFTDYTGMDPEVSLGGSVSNQYPSPKRFVLGVNFSF